MLWMRTIISPWLMISRRVQLVTYSIDLLLDLLQWFPFHCSDTCWEDWRQFTFPRFLILIKQWRLTTTDERRPEEWIEDHPNTYRFTDSFAQYGLQLDGTYSSVLKGMICVTLSGAIHDQVEQRLSHLSISECPRRFDYTHIIPFVSFEQARLSVHNVK